MRSKTSLVDMISSERGRGNGTSWMLATRPGRGLITTTRSDRKMASSIEWVIEHDGGPGIEPDLLDQPVHLLAGECVERAERLVHQQHGRPVGQRAHQRGALLHAARKLARKAAAEAFETDAIEQFIDPDTIGLGALDLEGKVDVGVEIAPGQQVRLLEHHADLRDSGLSPACRRAGPRRP